MTDFSSIQPLDDRVVLERLEGEMVRASGLIIAGAEDRNYPLRGRVVSCGPGAIDKGKLSPIDVEAGDEVYYVAAQVAAELADNHIMVREGAIVAKVVDGTPVPYWDKVLVELKPVEGSSLGGVVLISNDGEKYDTAVVVAAGPGYVSRGVRVPMDLVVGDRILCNQFDGMELDLGMGDLRRLYLLRETDVYGVLS